MYFREAGDLYCATHRPGLVADSFAGFGLVFFGELLQLIPAAAINEINANAAACSISFIGTPVDWIAKTEIEILKDQIKE